MTKDYRELIQPLLDWYPDHHRDLPWSRILVDEYEGRMPADYDKILSLPGIGAYTAGAISSIAFQLPHAAVDGNVLRILTRAREDARVTDEDKTRDCIRTDLEDALREMKTENYGMFNQAMMELGATVSYGLRSRRILCPRTQAWRLRLVCPQKEESKTYRGEDGPSDSRRKQGPH